MIFVFWSGQANLLQSGTPSLWRKEAPQRDDTQTYVLDKHIYEYSVLDNHIYDYYISDNHIYEYCFPDNDIYEYSFPDNDIYDIVSHITTCRIICVPDKNLCEILRPRFFSALWAESHFLLISAFQLPLLAE